MSLNSKSNSLSYSRQTNKRQAKNSRETQDDKLDSTASRLKPNLSCKLCVLFPSKSDLSNLMYEGLYKKYTLKMEYYYKKDINALLANRRKPFTIKFRDEQMFLNDSEFLKKFYRKKEIKPLLAQATAFCSQFRQYPRFFDPKFFRMMLDRVRAHRKLEYFLVFKGQKSTDRETPVSESKQVYYSDLLGESLKREVQESVKPRVKKGNKANETGVSRERSSMMEIKQCFEELMLDGFNHIDNKLSTEPSEVRGSAQNRNQLYSHSDSRSAINDLEDIIGAITAKPTEFKPMLTTFGGPGRNANVIQTRPKEQVLTVNGSLVKNKEDNGKIANFEGKRPFTPKVSPNVLIQEEAAFKSASVRSRRYNNYVQTSSQQKLATIEQANQVHKRLMTATSTSPHKNLFLAYGSNRKTIGLPLKAGSSSPPKRAEGNNKASKKDDKVNFQAYLEQLLEKQRGSVQSSSIRRPKKRSSESNVAVAMEKISLTDFNNLLNSVLQKDHVASSIRTGPRSKPPEIKVPGSRQNSLGILSPAGMNSPAPLSKHNRHKSHESLTTTQTSILSPSDKAFLNEIGALDSPQNPFKTSLSRGSKVHKSSKQLIEKVFSYQNTNYQTMSTAALIKSPTRKYDQRDHKAIMTTKNKNEWFGITSPKTDTTEINSPYLSKIPTPKPPAKENIINKEHLGNSQLVSPKKPLLQSGGVKAFREKFIAKTDSSQIEEIPLSGKLMLASPKRLFQSYGGQPSEPKEKRTSSVEESNSQRPSPKVGNSPNSSQLHARHQQRRSLRQHHDAINSIRKT